MNRFFICFYLAFTSTLQYSQATEFPWVYRLEHQIEKAKEKKAPLFLYFTASWCPPCQRMKRQTFSKNSVRESLSSYLSVKIDVDSYPEVSSEYNILGMPTFIVLNPFSEECGRQTGFLNEKQLIEWLEQIKPKAFVTESKWEKKVKEIEDLGKLLNDSNLKKKNDSILTLMNYTSEWRGPSRELALETLRLFARDHSSNLLPFLNNKKLVYRILTSNLLQENLGKSFQFDPWEKEDIRLHVIETWKTKLQERTP